SGNRRGSAECEIRTDHSAAAGRLYWRRGRDGSIYSVGSRVSGNLSVAVSERRVAGMEKFHYGRKPFFDPGSACDQRKERTGISLCANGRRWKYDRNARGRAAD